MKALLLPILLALTFSAAPAFADFCDGVNPLHHPQCQVSRAPITVESVRVKPRGSIATTHDTVVSRDGKVLLVIKGQLNQYNPGDTRTRKELGYE